MRTNFDANLGKLSRQIEQSSSSWLSIDSNLKFEGVTLCDQKLRYVSVGYQLEIYVFFLAVFRQF